MDAGFTESSHSSNSCPSSSPRPWLQSQARQCDLPPWEERRALEDGPPSGSLIRIRLLCEEDPVLRYEKVSAVKRLPIPSSISHTDLRSGARQFRGAQPTAHWDPHPPVPMWPGSSFFQAQLPHLPAPACTPTPHPPGPCHPQAVGSSGSVANPVSPQMWCQQLVLRGELSTGL